MTKRVSASVLTAVSALLLAAMPVQVFSQAKQPVLKGTERVKMFSAQAEMKAITLQGSALAVYRSHKHQRTMH
jgi:uncharacterized protein with FMN-binding domain